MERSRAIVSCIELMALLVFGVDVPSVHATPFTWAERLKKPLAWEKNSRSGRQGCKSRKVKVLCRQLPGSDG